MKNSKYKINSWVITAFVIVAVILVNLIVTAVNEKIPLKIDLTKDKIYEITDETKNAMSSLEKEVDAYILCPQADASTLVKEYVDRYKAMTDKINFKYIDVYKNQTLLNKYYQNGENINIGDIVLECGENSKVISLANVKNEITSIGGENLYSLDLESKLTNGIVSVTGMVKNDKVYFITGHGETESAGLQTAISDLNHVYDNVSLIADGVPKDANILVTVLPNADFSDDECMAIDAFLDRGGKLIAVYNPGLNSCPKFEGYLSEWGITPVHNLVCENDTQKMIKSPVIFRAELANHKINENINNMDLSPIYYGSISFNLNEFNSRKATVTSLSDTSDKAVGKSNINATNSDYEEGDVKGPMSVSALSEKDVTVDGETKKSAIIALGSMAVTDYTDERANVEFLRNLLNYLTENNASISIASKIITEGLFTQPSAFTISILYYLLVWIVPIGLLLVGIIIWLKRRYL